MKGIWRAALLSSVMAFVAMAGVAGLRADNGPTVQEYLADAGQAAEYVAPGTLTLARKRTFCGRRPTVLDKEFDTWAGAYPTFIILNPIYMKKEHPIVQHYIYAHECGHQFRGGDEDTADCFAIRRGVRYGWLNDRGMVHICNFIRKVPGDFQHPPGPQRCESMKRCYREIQQHRADTGAVKRQKAKSKGVSAFGIGPYSDIQ